MSQCGRPEYSAVRGLLFGANLTDVVKLRYVCLLFPDGKNILAAGGVPAHAQKPIFGRQAALLNRTQKSLNQPRCITPKAYNIGS